MSKRKGRRRIARGSMENIRSQFSLNNMRFLVFVVAFGAIGAAIILFSFAATPVSNTIEPESGNVSGNATATATATGASGGYITFNAPATCPAGQTGTPPNCVTPGNGSCTPLSPRPFSCSSFWNTPTPTSGITWSDASWLHNTFYIDTDAANVVTAAASDPTWTWNMPSYIATDYHRNRPAQTFTGHAPANITVTGDSDKILAVIQPDGTYYETWQTVINSSARTITSSSGESPPKVGWATGNVNTGPGGGTLSNNDGVRAANFSWIAGVISKTDVANLKIDHALAFAMADISTGPSNYVAPATAWENIGNGGAKMGVKFGIPSTAAKPSGLSPVGSAVFDALQKYGAYVGDYAGDDGQFYAQVGVDPNGPISRLIDNWDFPKSDYDIIQPLLRVAN